MSRRLLGRIAPYRDTAQASLCWHALGRPRAHLPGIPIGISLDSNNELIAVDLDILKEILPQLRIKDVGILGEQGFGKTFLLYLLLYLWSNLDVGKDGEICRIKIDSYKRTNRKDPEVTPLVEGLLGCKVIVPGRMRLNPLSRRFLMTFDEKYTLVARLLRFRLKRDLTLEEDAVLKACLRVMETARNDPSLPGLRRELAKYNPATGVEGKSSQQRAKMPYAERLAYEQADADYRNRLAAASTLQLALQLFEDGEYGRLLYGQDHGEENFNLITQRIVSIDYHGISSDFRSVIEIVLASIYQAAATPHPENEAASGPRLPELVAHVVATDEAYRPWENSEFVAAEYADRKTRREGDRTGVMVWHRLGDFFQAISNEDGAGKGANIINEIKVWFIGRQTSNALNDIRKFFGEDLNEDQIKSLPNLNVGEFYLILPGVPTIRMQVMTIPKLTEKFNTELAHRELLQRYYKVGEKLLYIRYIEELTRTIEERVKEGVDDEALESV